MPIDGEPRNPFPGLRPFGPEEAHLFFGREEHVDELLETLKRSRLVAVLGTSGSGKSSLVLAGLFPALDGGAGGAQWRIARMRPGNDPIGNLARALRDPDVLGAAAEEVDPEEAELERSITEATLKRSHLGLIRAAAELHLQPGERFLLLVDQLEELFRGQRSGSGLVRSDETNAFVQLLLEAARQAEVPVYVLLTLRSEFLGDCVRFPGLPEAINSGQYLIPRLTRRQRETVITGPARVGGAEVSPLLLQRLLNDVGDNPDQLPILQHALMRTFDLWLQQGRPDAPIGLAEYEAVGGMAQALDRHAEAIFAELDARQREIAEVLFRTLTERSAEGHGIRRPAALGEIAAIAGAGVEEVLAVVESFRASGRTFLVLPRGAPVTPDTLVDISHESLMRIWSRLSGWTEEEAKAADLYRRIAADAEHHAAGEAGLWGDPELELALRWWEKQRPGAAWARRYGLPFEPVREFLDQSREARDREVEEKERAQRRELEQAQALAEAEQRRAASERRSAERLRRAVLFISIALLVTVASTIWALFERERAEDLSRASAEKEIQALATAADHLAHWGSQLDALMGARQAGRRLRELVAAEGPHPELRRTVEDALTHSLFTINEKNRWEGHAGWPNALVLSYDGKTILSAGWEQIIRRWRLDGSPLPSLAGHGAPVITLAASPVDDGLVSGDGDGVLRFWSPDGRSVAVPRAHAGEDLRSLSYRGDGALVASGGDDGEVRFWRPDGAPVAVHPVDWGCSVRIVRFHPREPLLATGCEDGEVALWQGSADGRDWRRSLSIRAHEGPVVALAFDPEGGKLASAGTDDWTRVWSLQGAPLAAYESAGPVYAVAFGPGGRSVVAGGADRMIRIWRDDGQRLVLHQHTEPVTALAFAPDGTLVSTGRDMSVRLWQLDNPFSTPLTGHRGTVWEVDVDPRGSLIASGGDDGTVKLWSFDGGLLASFGRFRRLVRSVRFSPDGRLLAAGSHDGRVRLWEVGDGRNAREVADFLADRTGVNEVSFSPDSRTLATAGLGGLIRFWSTAGPDAGRAAGELRSIRGQVWGVRFGARGELLWIGSDPAAFLRLPERPGVLELRGHRSGIVRSDFSPAGDRIATVEVLGTVILWDREGRLIRTFPSTWLANDVEFGPNGRRLAVACRDGAVRLWNAGDGTLLRTLRGHGSSVTFSVFGPDGRTLVTSSSDETVRIWRRLDLDFDSLMAEADRWLKDYLALQGKKDE